MVDLLCSLPLLLPAPPNQPPEKQAVEGLAEGLGVDPSEPLHHPRGEMGELAVDRPNRNCPFLFLSFLAFLAPSSRPF